MHRNRCSGAVTVRRSPGSTATARGTSKFIAVTEVVRPVFSGGCSKPFLPCKLVLPSYSCLCQGVPDMPNIASLVAQADPPSTTSWWYSPLGLGVLIAVGVTLLVLLVVVVSKKKKQ